MKRAVLAAALIGMFVASITTSAQSEDKVRITGWAVNFNNSGTGANTAIEINIDKWSTAAQRENLISVFMEKKQNGLLDALRKLPEIGRWRFPALMGPDPNNYKIGTAIRYAMSRPGDNGGRSIVIMTDRIIGFEEATTQGRSMDYPFTLLEMHFDKAGKGEGRMAVYTQLNFNDKKKALEIENWGSEPVRLNQLSLEVKK
jgi:hypothetical protein